MDKRDKRGLDSEISPSAALISAVLLPPTDWRILSISWGYELNTETPPQLGDWSQELSWCAAQNHLSLFAIFKFIVQLI